MNAILIIIPFMLIRFGLLSMVNKEAVKRAAFFAPLIGKEKAAYWLYQISNILFFVYLCFLKITADPYWLYAGLVIYGLGVLLCLVSVFSFAKPAVNGINLVRNTNGLPDISPLDYPVGRKMVCKKI